MKKYFILIPVVIIISATALLIGKSTINNTTVLSEQSSKNHNEDTVVSKGNPEMEDCCRLIKSAGVSYSDMSIYQSNGTWTDQNNHKKEIGSFKGKDVVIAMFFASCRSACPVIVENMKKIETIIPITKRNNYRFVLISIDPENDTPSELLNYAKMRGLKYPEWTLLNGNNSDIMELSMLLGFKYSKNKKNGFTHNNLISFLNRDGEIVFQNSGLVIETDSITNAIKKLN